MNTHCFFERTKRRTALILGTSLITLLLLSSSYSDQSEERLLAEKLFAQVEEKFSKIHTLSYTVERNSHSKLRRQKERWIFKSRQPSDLRVEYLAPHYRLIVVNSNVLWEYIPEKKKAMRTNLAVMGREKRQRIIATVFAHVSVAGIRLGDYATMLERVASIHASESDNNVYIVKGSAPKYVVVIDSAKGVLLRTELYDAEDKLTIRTEASRFLEIAPSFWFPQEIRITYRARQELVQSTVYLSDIRSNEIMPDDIFDFKPSDTVKVINN